MPAVSSRVPKYCHFKPRNLAYVRIRGKMYYLGRYDTPESRQAYRRLLADLEATPADPTESPGAGPRAPARACPTVVEVCADYLDFAEGYYVKNGRPTKQVYHVHRTIRMLKECDGNTLAVDFGPLALRRIQERMVKMKTDPPRVQARYCRTTVNKTCESIKRIFKWAASQEIVPVSVYQSLATVPGLKRGRTPARECPPVKPVPDDAINATLPHLPQVVADMVRFERLTGCRPGEVCLLKPADVDRSRQVWEYRPTEHKTEHHGRGRVIFIGPKAKALLVRYMLAAPDSYCFSPAESESRRRVELRARRKSPVQPSQRNRRKSRPVRKAGTHYSENSYARTIRRGIEKANQAIREEGAKAKLTPAEIEARLVPYWHPNQLRHAQATEIRRQFGLEAAQTVLGHASANVTQVYAERDLELAARVMEKIG